MSTDRVLLLDPMPEAEARERLGAEFARVIAAGVAMCDRCRREAFDAQNFGEAAAYETAGRIARLIRWIDTHDTRAQTIYNGDGTLTVASPVVVDSRLTVEHDVIPATISAARDLLGY